MTEERGRPVAALTGQAEIESLDIEGRGVARVDGKVVFIEGALPRERVRFTTIRRRPSYDIGRIDVIERSAAERVSPRCPHFGIGKGHCGGCSMQHLDVRAQVAVKQRALEDALWHIAKLRPGVALRPIIGAAWNYRQRARLTVRYVDKKGGVLIGFHERASSYVADMTECHVLPVHVAAMLPALRRLVASLSICRRVPQIELAAGGASNAPVTVLVFRVLDPPNGNDREALAAFGRHHGVSVWLQTGGPATVLPLDPADSTRLTLDLPEFDVSIPFLPTDFTQVNHAVNAVLVRRAVRLLGLRSSDRVVDFFCGLGNFTLPLARRAGQVIGLEGAAALVERARAAAALHALSDRTDFAVRNLFEFGIDDWQALQSRGTIDAVLVDPPREGALAIVRAIAAAGNDRAPLPRTLVYVSCNAATLARDCAVLVHEGGWRLDAAGVVNMFAHTAHVESIARLVPPGG